MGVFQASMLEAFNNLREDFQKSLQKQREVDQTSSSSANKTNTPSKDLNKPSKASSAIESMEMEYGPDLPPRLDSYSSCLKDDSGQVRSSAEDPSKVALTKPKQVSHSSRYHVMDPSSASDLYSDYSNDPQPAPSRPKKYSDKSKHKSRAKFLPSSSEEDQSPEHRHRSPKPSRKSYTDQDHPQHDPDPPYYREVALSDIPLTQSLGWIINQEKSELNPTQVFSFVGYEYHLDTALVKPTQERWLKLQDFILQLKSKHVLTARCLMSLIGLPASTEKMVSEGRLYMRPFQFHLKEHWKFPQPLDSLLPWTEAISAHLDWWQNPANVMKGSDLHPKDHSIQLFTDASNEGWDAHLEQSSTQGLWSPQEKGLHINVLELKAVFLALRHFKDQCHDQTVVVATDNSTVVAYINKEEHTQRKCAHSCGGS